MDRMNGKGGSCSMYLKVNIYTTGMYDNSMNGGGQDCPLGNNITNTVI